MAKRIDFAHTGRPDSARKFSVAESLTAPRTYRETRSRLPVAAMELPGHQVSPRHSNIYWNITTLGFALDLRNFWEPLSKKFV